MTKSKGGLGFRSLFDFNLALLGKHCSYFITNPQSLVARVFKAQYYPNTHFMKATLSSGASFIWLGILTAKETISDSFKWILGNGMTIEATNDPWLKRTPDFGVERNYVYATDSSTVASFLMSTDRS